MQRRGGRGGRRSRKRGAVALVAQALSLDPLEDKVHPRPGVLVGGGVAVGGVGVPVDLQEPVDDGRGAVAVAVCGAVSSPKVAATAAASFGTVQRHGGEGSARVGEADDVPGIEAASGQRRARERGREGERRRRRRRRRCCWSLRWWWRWW